MADNPEPGLDIGSDTLQLLKHALVHFGTALVLLCLFAASDSWSALTGWKLASLLSVVTGFAAGFAVTTVLHEWFHLLGARLSGGAYTIPQGVSFFVYDWKFDCNTVRQFYTMSLAGSIGGLMSVCLLAAAIAPDNAGRLSVVAGAVMSFTFGAIIEWPVLKRTLASGQPMEELSKIDQTVLTRAFTGGAVAALIVFWWLG